MSFGAHQDLVLLALLVAIGALLVLSAVFAGLAWWFGWNVERLVGRRGASWDALGEFGDWIRTGQ